MQWVPLERDQGLGRPLGFQGAKFQAAGRFASSLALSSRDLAVSDALKVSSFAAVWCQERYPLFPPVLAIHLSER